MRLHRVTIPGHANLAASNTFTAPTQKEVMSESILAEAKSIVSEHPDANASSVFLEGDPAAQILWYANEIAADMVVMGRRGRGRAVGLLLGSVSQGVTGAARQFVLLAPPGK